MIDPKELRIGNKIIANGLHGGAFMTVEQIGSKGTLSDDNRVILFGEHVTGEFIKDCVGIPLTPEILEACGFKDGHISFSYHTHISVRPYETASQGIFPGQWSVTLMESIPHRLGKSIRYLHQLQNLIFALTGSELQVNLKEKV